MVGLWSNRQLGTQRRGTGFHLPCCPHRSMAAAPETSLLYLSVDENWRERGALALGVSRRNGAAATIV